jgi:hypothetical protein
MCPLCIIKGWIAALRRRWWKVDDEEVTPHLSLVTPPESEETPALFVYGKGDASPEIVPIPPRSTPPPLPGTQGKVVGWIGRKG